jgi:formate-dependent nitrite reductase cytochrome c552 subunit
MNGKPRRHTLLLKLAWLPAAVPLAAAVCQLHAQVNGTAAQQWEASIKATTPQPPAGTVGFNDNSPKPSHHDLSASTYVGYQVCAGCHGRLTSTRPHHTIIQEWEDPTNNAHANDAGALINGTLLTRTIADGVPESPVKSCATCHTTGSPNFDQPQVATKNGYDPSQPFNDYHHNALLLRVQCENCHGPGSQHVLSGGDTRLINRVPDPKQTCWNCHVHQPNEKGNLLVAPATDAQLALYTTSLGHTHAAGGLVAGTGGYEYTGEDYTQGHLQPHTKIATTCITCHLPRAPRSPTLDHSDLDAKITACRNCHADASRVASLDDWGYLQSRQENITKLLIQLGGATATGDPDFNAAGGLLGNAADKTSSDYKRARWNYAIVINDGSLGAHNYDYALELLLTSIAHAPAQKP